MLVVALTLCAIIAVIWWLTGSSRYGESSSVTEVTVSVAEEALEHLQPSVFPVGRTDAVGPVLLDVLVGVGMDAFEAESIVRGLGYSVTSHHTSELDERKLTVYSLKDEYARASLERALLVGIELARIDDDYAGVSDDALAFESLCERADEVETALFDDRRRALLDFYNRAALVLQDRVQTETDDSIRGVMGGVLARLDEAVEGLQEEMRERMAALPADLEMLAWGDSTDRRRYYFKMGVTNSLRRSGHMSSLGHLYRFRGVNYDVEEAFQLAGQEEPLLLRAAQLEFISLISLGPSEVKRMTRERRLGRSIPNTES